jgi:hypothetical protein
VRSGLQLRPKINPKPARDADRDRIDDRPEPTLAEPAVAVDKMVLHHRDLARRTAEGLQ